MSTRHIRFLCGQRTLLSSLNTSVPVHVRGRCPASTAAAVHESSDPSAQRTHQSEDLKPFSAIPGPKPLPLLRNLLQFKKNSSRLNPYLEECYNKYGEIFKLEAPGQCGCVTKSSYKDVNIYSCATQHWMHLHDKPCLLHTALSFWPIRCIMTQNDTFWKII